MKYLATTLLVLVGVTFAQTKPQPKGQSVRTPTWLRVEGYSEIQGHTLGFMLPSTETPISSVAEFSSTTVHLTVVCESGNPSSAFIEVRIPLHLDEVDRTYIQYREGDKVVSMRTKIGDSGTSAYNPSAKWFKVFVGKAIQVEDVFGNMHIFHFPSVGLEPFEDGCK